MDEGGTPAEDRTISVTIGYGTHEMKFTLFDVELHGFANHPATKHVLELAEKHLEEVSR